MIHHQKLREIVDKHLGHLIKFTVDVKSDNRLKLTFLYEDMSLVLFEYKMILNVETDEIEFIKNKSTSFRKGFILPNVAEFEQEIRESMKLKF